MFQHLPVKMQIIQTKMLHLVKEKKIIDEYTYTCTAYPPVEG